MERRGDRAVIINADSAQMYADLSILTARPTAAEMGGVPHRLYGVWDGARPGSAGRYAALAVEAIDDAHAAGAVPILVGGTGLYLRAVLEGLAPVPDVDPVIRAEVRRLPQDEAWAALLREDPPIAASLNPNDASRTQRALEVKRSTGRSLRHWRAVRTGGLGHRVATTAEVLLPNRDSLYACCDSRVTRMFESGAVAEVERLLARRLPPELPVMRAIGVPQIAALLRGERTLESALEQTRLATRQYAKRQYTWFRHSAPAHWQRFGPAC